MSDNQDPKQSAAANDKPAETEPAADPNTSAPEADAATAPPLPQPPKPRGGVLIWFFVFLLLVGLAALGYWQWLQYQGLQSAEQSWQNRLETQDGRSDRLAAEIAALQQQLSERRQALADTNQRNQALTSEVADLRRRLLAMTSTTNDDWKLAEAYYLTRLAGQRLVMERSPTGALALLQTADEILKDRSDPALYDVRAQLAADITALKLAEPVDREGLFLQLAALSDAIAELPHPVQRDYRALSASDAPATSEAPVANKKSATDETTAVGQNPEADDWRQRLQNSFDRALQGLKGFITITHHDQPLQPAPLVERELVATRLQLLLESAQWALLREQPTVYQHNLQQADELLQRYYPSQPEAERLGKLLRELAERDIVQQLPNIDRSQQLLGDYLTRLNRLSSQGLAPGDQSTETTAPEEATP